MTTMMQRRGFTLVEMLVVITIIIVLASVATVVTLRMQERDQVPRAATAIQGALNQAKTRALRDRRPSGVRLVVQPPASNEPWCTWPYVTQLTYIEEPDDITDQYVSTYNYDPLSRAPLNATHPLYNRILAAGPDPVPTPPTFTWGDGAVGAIPPAYVQSGDWVEIDGGGQPYQVELNPFALGLPKSVFPPVGGQWPPGSGQPPLIVLNRPVTQPVTAPVNGLSNYRIIRQPRPVPGEQPVLLPADTEISLQGWPVGPPTPDSTNSHYVSGLTQLPAAGSTLEILFSPSGRVLGAAGSSDVIYLWVREHRDPLAVNPENQALVAIYTKTGAVNAYAVAPPPSSPYLHAQKARGGGDP